MNNSYNIRSTKIGNSAGFRLPADFYREHPQFANADGWIEVLSPDTAIVRIVPQLHDDKDAEDSLLMRLFLDFATTEALKNQLNSIPKNGDVILMMSSGTFDGLDLKQI
jgi:antitoxin PrlF